MRLIFTTLLTVFYQTYLKNYVTEGRSVSTSMFRRVRVVLINDTQGLGSWPSPSRIHCATLCSTLSTRGGSGWECEGYIYSGALCYILGGSDSTPYCGCPNNPGGVAAFIKVSHKLKIFAYNLYEKHKRVLLFCDIVKRFESCM